MASVYLKSPDARSVVAISSGNRSRRIPAIPTRYFDEGWKQIGYQEFRRLRTIIQKRTHHATERERILPRTESRTEWRTIW